MVEGQPLPTFFAHIPLPAYVFQRVDEEFVLEDVNLVAVRLNPLVETFRGKPMAGLYRDQPQILDDAHRCLAGRETIVRETPLRLHDRTEATSMLRLTFVPIEGARLMLFVENVATPDIAELATRETEARYRSLIASLPNAMLLRALDGRVLACNDVAVRLFGAAHTSDLSGRRAILPPGWRFLSESGAPLGPDDLPSLRVLETGRAEAGVVLGLETPAGLRWLLVAAQPVMSTAGQVNGSIATYSDLTELMTAQRALHQSARRLDLALDAGRMGVWEFAPGADVGWWSPNLDEIFKVPPTATGFAPFLGHVHPDDRARLLASAVEIVQSPGDTFELEFRITGSDGATRWARLSGSRSNVSGQVTLSGVIKDVTEQHRLEEELRRAHRLESLGKLAGGIAHDFNNLLAAITGSLELVELHCAPAAFDDVATIRHGANRARDLTRQLLAFARQQPLEYKVVDLAELMRKAERLLKRLVGTTVEIAIAPAGNGLWVRADESLLEQVVVNLVINARDAMPNGGRVTLGVEPFRRTPDPALPAGELVTLFVVDTGVGMDAETRNRAFDPFFTTKTHGTGLGLASSYGIVRQHGGTILVESEHGSGSRFDVVLPRVEGHVAKGAEAEPARTSAHAQRRVVLVVDDEDLVRRTAVRVLASLGYDVLSAGSAVEALALVAARAEPIDFLLCDIAMPDRDGPSLAVELATMRPGLKVIFVSGYAEVPIGAMPGARFLPKPYSRGQLAALLHDDAWA